MDREMIRWNNGLEVAAGEKDDEKDKKILYK